MGSSTRASAAERFRRQREALRAKAAPAPLRGPRGRRPETIDVAAGLVFHRGKLLITRRQPDVHLGGLWEFPGGKRERGETYARCLVRELREELAIDVRVGELILSITHEYPEKTVHLKFFRCERVRGEPAPLGCSEFKWIGRLDLEDYEFPAADRRLLKALRKIPDLWRPLPRGRRRPGKARRDRKGASWHCS